MSILLGVIADDYTGASDLANTLTRNGLRTVQAIGIPSDSFALPEVDAVVVALKIRSVPAAEAVAAATAAAAWLRGRGATHLLYKICSTFDSTDAGNIGPVTEALAGESSRPVLVTPAFPETGRTVYLGHLFVNGVPLNESPLKDHPLNPMHDANLVRVLARQSRRPVALVDAHTIASGAAAVRERLSALAGNGVAIADAVFERDLEALGEVALDAEISTGASGLGLGLARALVKSGKAAGNGGKPAALGKVGGLAAVVVGSCSKATLEQVAAADVPVRTLDCAALLAGADEVGDALAWAGERVGQGPVLISAAAPPDQVATLQAKHGREASGRAVEAATARITEALVAKGVRRLVLAGGETSGAAIDRLAVPAFLVGPEIAAGVPLMRTVGASQGDMLVALKSGNFGGRDFFARALAMMQE